MPKSTNETPRRSKATPGTSKLDMYPPPDDMSVKNALVLIFKHYSSPWKTTMSKDHNEVMLDSQHFVKMCREAPGLETKRMTRHDYDIVFTKCQHPDFRRLDFEHFLDSLLDLSLRRYPEDDPVTGFARLLTRHIFGLFDQAPVRDNTLLDKVKEELALF